MPAHNHPINLIGSAGPDATVIAAGGTSVGKVPYTGFFSPTNVGGGAAHNNLQPYVAMKYYIRAEPFSVVYARMLPLYGKIPSFADYRTNPL
jgi:hypothetical protein